MGQDFCSHSEHLWCCVCVRPHFSVTVCLGSGFWNDLFHT